MGAAESRFRNKVTWIQFILCIGIVYQHTKWNYGNSDLLSMCQHMLHYLIQTCVPFFFVISGYLLNILVQEYRCSGGTETANPAAGNRCSETGIPHLVTSYLCEFTRLKLDLIHILPAWTCNYLGLSG